MMQTEWRPESLKLAQEIRSTPKRTASPPVSSRWRGC